MRVLLFGATGTIGRAVATALSTAGHDAVAVGRRDAQTLPTRIANLHDPDSLISAIKEERFDAALSCLASRSGAPKDAWSIDHDAHQSILRATQDAHIKRFVQLSAICVQKPDLAFQKAKLAFEQSLMASDHTWTIVRPTAFFKSLSGQVQRVADGKPFLAFGNGERTSCKPISDRDLASFMVQTLENPEVDDKICPIGGPGPALSPRDQAGILQDLLGRPVALKKMPVAAMRTIITGLSLAGAVSKKAAEKAALARIGLYYGTESMLVRDPATGAYSADKTPETGADTLRDHYAALLKGEITHDLAEHAIF